MAGLRGPWHPLCPCGVAVPDAIVYTQGGWVPWTGWPQRQPCVSCHLLRMQWTSTNFSAGSFYKAVIPAVGANYPITRHPSTSRWFLTSHSWRCLLLQTHGLSSAWTLPHAMLTACSYGSFTVYGATTPITPWCLQHFAPLWCFLGRSEWKNTPSCGRMRCLWRGKLVPRGSMSVLQWTSSAHAIRSTMPREWY